MISVRERAIVQDPLLPFLGVDVLALGRVDDYKLRANAASLFKKCCTLVGEKVAVEVGRDESIEIGIGKNRRRP